jgi:hypothetical protein
MYREIKKSSRWQKLRKIFENQVMVLERLVTDTESIKQVSFLRDGPLKRHVITRALDLGLENAAIPILAVIPRNCMETMRQISFINFNGVSGTTGLSLNKVRDMEEKLPHHHPYWAFGVDIGTETMNMVARTATEKIVAEKRYPLTLAEIIALHIQYPETLKFSTNACGSSYRMGESRILERIPAIYICNQQPTATWNTLDKNRTNCDAGPWITPSCMERMGNLGLMTYIQRRYWRVRRERK